MYRYLFDSFLRIFHEGCRLIRLKELAFTRPSRWPQISRAFATRQPCRQLLHALLLDIRTLGAVQPLVGREQALAFERGVEGVGSGVLLQRRQKVFEYHHSGAASVGGGPAPIAARGLRPIFLRQASGLHALLLYEPAGTLHVVR